MQNFDENPEFRKIYWMNQGMWLQVMDSNKSFQMHGWNLKIHYILIFKSMLTFFHEDLKMQKFDGNPEIRKIY